MKRCRRGERCWPLDWPPHHFPRGGVLVGVFTIVGDFAAAIPASIIFMPIFNRLTEVGNINPVHMGVCIIVTLAFGLITPRYGITLLMAAKFTGVNFTRAMMKSLQRCVVFLCTVSFCILFPDVVLWMPRQVMPQAIGCFKPPGAAH